MFTAVLTAMVKGWGRLRPRNVFSTRWDALHRYYRDSPQHRDIRQPLERFGNISLRLAVLGLRCRVGFL